jgi:hypothetical protein
MFPRFPAFPNAFAIKGIGRGTLRGTLLQNSPTFPFFRFARVRKTFPFEGELPSASLVGHPDRSNARLESGDVEHPVAHAHERFAQPGSLGAVATCA